MTRTNRTLSIASDRRGRVPFAVVGVLLLLSSAVIVASLQSRPDVESDVDPALVLDRSESATGTTMKDAILEATERAAASPVTEPAEEGPFEELLGEEDADPDDVFREYVALLVYREVYSRVNGTSHTVRENATATVTLPAIDGIADARDGIDRVSFEHGTEDGTTDLDPGETRVTVEDVSFAVTEGGDHVTTRTRPVTVTVASPVFQLHDRVQLYQERLNMSMVDGGGYEGVGRRFTLRTYPVVIAKSMANYYKGTPTDAPIQRIVPHKQTEVLANDAIYAVQSNTFETRDPDWYRPMTSRTLCWLTWEYENNVEDDTLSSNFSSIEDVTNGTFDDDDVCEGAEALFGDSSGDPDAIPSIGELTTSLLPHQDSLQTGEDVSYALFSQMAWATLHETPHDYSDEIVGDPPDVNDDDRGTIEDKTDLDGDDHPPLFGPGAHTDVREIVEDVYSMDLTFESETDPPQFDIDSPDGEGWELVNKEYVDLEESVEITDEWESRDISETNPLLYTVNIQDEIKLEKTWERNRSETRSDTGSLNVTIRIRGEYAPDANITDVGPWADRFDNITDHSGQVETLFEGSGNFENAPGYVFEEIFGVERDGATHELEERLDNKVHENEAALLDTIGVPDIDRINDHTVMTRFVTGLEDPREQLKGYAEDELDTARRRVTALGPVSFNRSEFLSGNPLRDMSDRLNENYSNIVHRSHSPSEPFEDMEAFLRAEVRHRHHKTAFRYIRREANEHDRVLEEQFGDNRGTAMSLAADAVSRDAPKFGGSMGTTELLGNVSFEVRGSPTYLEFDDLERETVPAIRPEGEPAHNITDIDDVEHVSAVGRYENRVPYFGVPILPSSYGTWYVTGSSWHVQFKGEYARFEVTANVSEQSRMPSLTYVREDKDVETTIAGTTATIGAVEPIRVDTSAEFPMVVPAGKAGTGDPDGSLVDETEEWDYIGPGYEDVEDDGEED